MSELRIGIIGNPDRHGITAALEMVLRELADVKPARCILSSDVESIVGENTSCEFFDDHYEIARNADAIIALGGDGTMLGASRAIMRGNPECRLLGVNLGKLGFIAENPPEDIPRLIQGLVAGTLITERRLIVSANVSSDNNLGVLIKHDDLDEERHGSNLPSADLVALNEIVIDNFGSTRMLTFEVNVNGSLLGNMRADGLIVASPTGSTGYAVSAGGPIIEPTSPVMLITPIAPHSLSVRPIIIAEGSEIVIRATSVESRHALVVADGQEEVVAATTAIVRIKSASQKLNLLRLPENSYFDLLREKMFWSVDPIEGTKGRR